MKDFLGTEISIGVRGVRVHSYSHNKDFKKVTILNIDESREYGDCIELITDGNQKSGWTYPRRIIVQDSFKVDL